MTQKNIIKQLATTLEISEDQVLTIKPYPEGWTVITTDYRKYTAVQPTEPPAPAAAEIPLEPTIDLTHYPSFLPAELAPVWNQPRRHKVAELRDLAVRLQIPDAEVLVKASLLDAIEAYKEPM